MKEQGPLFGEILVKLGLVTDRQVQEALALQVITKQRVGEALISLGYVTRAQLEFGLFEALGLSSSGRSLERPPLGELLIGLKYIDAEQLARALRQQRTEGRRLGEILVDQSACTYKQVYEALSLQQRMSAKHHEGDTRAAIKTPLDPRITRVMVVDDSDLALAVVTEGLTPLGYEVVTFSDPFEALAQVMKVKPSIVLTDLDMPGIDGAELCRRLKSGPARAVPVVMLTANDADGQRISGLRAGADDYVNKSASMEELAARIDSIVRRTSETERMRKLFARYTSDAVVEEILKSGEIVLTGEKREVTVLFADIRNFTSLAETLAPEDVVGLLNEVLGRLSDAVLTCGGTLDKFLGDGLMAVFGAPVGRDDDALRAFQAAQMMQEQMELWHADAVAAHRDGRRPRAPPDLQLGIGINSGPAVAGNLGSALRTEYTCIGDAVNVGSRLCALALPGEILIGERTRVLVGDSGRFEALPAVRLKGKAQPVPLFRVLGKAVAPIRQPLEVG